MINFDESTEYVPTHQAERERRAVIIKSQGELSASENLKKVIEMMSSSGAISLKTLQTIEAVSDNQGHAVVFALPTEIIDGIKRIYKG